MAGRRRHRDQWDRRPRRMPEQLPCRHRWQLLDDEQVETCKVCQAVRLGPGSPARPIHPDDYDQLP